MTKIGHSSGKWGLGGIFALGIMLAQAAVAGPHVVLAENVWDFGTITNENELQRDITVRNEGTAELVIDRVTSSCDQCLVTRMEGTTIPAGETGLLRCWLDVRTMQGPVEREVYLYSNDEERSPMLVSIKGTVVPLYRISPMGINLDLASSPVDQVEIVPLVKLRAPLSEVICTNEGVAASVAAAGFGRSVLTVQGTDSLPHTNLFIVLTVRSTNSADPPCRVKAYIRNPPDLEIMPPKLQFHAVDEAQVGILWISRRGIAAPTLLDVVSPSDKYHCEIDPAPDGSGYRVYVTALQQDSLAGQSSQLTVKLQDSDQKERSIPVPITVAAKEWRIP